MRAGAEQLAPDFLHGQLSMRAGEAKPQRALRAGRRFCGDGAAGEGGGRKDGQDEQADRHGGAISGGAVSDPTGCAAPRIFVNCAVQRGGTHRLSGAGLQNRNEPGTRDEPVGGVDPPALQQSSRGVEETQYFHGSAGTR